MAASLLTRLDVHSIRQMTAPNQKYSAVILGATGAVGSALVRELLLSNSCERVTAIIRRNIPDDSPCFMQLLPENRAKLVQHVVDIEQLEQNSRDILPGHQVAFITFGAGQPSKMEPEQVYHIDVDIPSKFARLCRESGTIEQISLLSGMGVPTDARRFDEGPPPVTFWTKHGGSMKYFVTLKSQIQNCLTTLGFRRVSIFQPSILITPESRYGGVDVFNQKIFPKLSWMLPTDYHEVRIEELARAMRIDAERNFGVQGCFSIAKPQFNAYLALEP